MVDNGSMRWVFRVGQLACLAAVGLLWLIDAFFAIDSGIFGRPAGSALGLVHLGLPLLAVGTWLPRYPQGSLLLPVLVLVLAVASVVVAACLSVWIHAGGGESVAVGFSGSACWCLTLLVVARRGALPLSIGAVAAGVLALTVLPLQLGTSPSIVIVCLLVAVIGSCCAGSGFYLRHLDVLRERLLVASRAEQRAEFARDLHDFIAHHVTGIIVQAQGARMVAESNPQRVVGALEQIERAGLETMTAMRQMVGLLRNHGAEAPTAPPRNIADLGPLLESFSATSGPPVRLTVEGSLEQLPIHVTTSAHRVVMEALTNIRKHASTAGVVDVMANRTRDWLIVTVTDDAPFSSRAGRLGEHGGLRRGEHGGFGLTGLTEQVESIGGQFRAGPGIGRGWVVEARFPLREQDKG